MPDAPPSAPAVHAFDDDLGRIDAVATGEAIDAGELTTREVLEATVARARKVEPQLGAIACERFDEVLAAPAPERKRPGSLDALPTFIKDMVPVAGLPLTWGSVALHGGPPIKKSKGIAVDFDRIGMVAIGLSTMPEFGFTSSTEFPQHRPDPQPLEPRALDRRLLRRRRRARRSRRRPDRARGRRWRLDPDPGGLRRPRRPQADARPAPTAPRGGADAGRGLRRWRRHALRSRHRALLRRDGAVCARTESCR